MCIFVLVDLIGCIRNNDVNTKSPIDKGCYASILANMANISYRMGGESIEYQPALIQSRSWSDENKYLNYQFPVVDGLGNIFTVINRLDKINAIYKVNPAGKVDHIVGLGSQHEAHFSMGGDRLVWSEIRVHPRWVREDHSVIIVYDLNKNSKSQITTKGKYFTPGLDASGQKIAALHTDSLGNHNLHILDAKSGLTNL